VKAQSSADLWVCRVGQACTTTEPAEDSMIRRIVATAGLCVALGLIGIAQSGKVIPRPPAQAPGQQPPGESAAPDGYAPIPQWLGQTRAPVPAKTAQFEVQTFAEGLNGGYGLHFLPDGRIIL